MQEKNVPPGIRISQYPFSLYDSIVSIPIYMAGEISRLANGI